MSAIQQILLGISAQPPTYRYLRFHETANATGQVASLWELAYSADAGATWVPSSAMTSNTAPSPFVASASSEYSAAYAAWKGFDNNSSGTRWSAYAADPGWLTIDLGDGNGIAPNRVRFVTYSLGGGNDSTPKDFTIQGSNTGAFAGEQVTLLTITGAASQPNQTTLTYTIWVP